MASVGIQVVVATTLGAIEAAVVRAGDRTSVIETTRGASLGRHLGAS